MMLSVVVSTLNDRERLLSCLDALETHRPATLESVEIIVVNGPSSDGTTGAVRAREDVDVLVEISERNPNVSRNAGLEVATGEIVAFLRAEKLIEPSWYEAVETAANRDVDVVTGPVYGTVRGAMTSETNRTFAGRSVTGLNEQNVAFDRTIVTELDGFDEYVTEQGVTDCAHRVASLGATVHWSDEMGVQTNVGTDGGQTEPDWGQLYRSRAYIFGKNYGLRPTVLRRPLTSAISDGLRAGRAVLSGSSNPSNWFANGSVVALNLLMGLQAGIRARYDDRRPQRNPNGMSTRHDRAVTLYDRRDTSSQ